MTSTGKLNESGEKGCPFEPNEPPLDPPLEGSMASVRIASSRVEKKRLTFTLCVPTTGKKLSAYHIKFLHGEGRKAGP